MQLEELKKAKEIIESVIVNDIRTGIPWLSHARFSYGYLKDAIKEIEKNGIK